MRSSDRDSDESCEELERLLKMMRRPEKIAAGQSERDHRSQQNDHVDRKGSPNFAWD